MPDAPAPAASLSPAKRALLDRILAFRAPSAAAPVPRAPDGPVPLTFEQRRLWLLGQLAPGTSVYTIPLGFRLRGPLDPDALRTAVRTLVERHDALRMQIAGGEEPTQSPSADARFGWETADVRETEGDGRDAAARSLVRGFLARPFDLAREPLLRALLVRVRDDEHRLALAIHHVAADGWSTGILRRELGEAYAAAVEGRAPDLPPPPVGYRDFAAWQRRVLTDRALSASVEYWRRELEGAPTVFELLPDRPRPPVQNVAGAKAIRVVPTGLTAQLRALGRREGTTPFAVLAAAWAAVLRRHSGEDDFLLGTVDANRWAAEVETVVGFFANTVPLRFRLSVETTVRGAVQQAHRAIVGAREHARLPFDRIAELSGARRDPSRPLLVQSLLVYNDTAAAPPRLPGIDASYEAVDTGASAFDLTLSVEDLGAVLHVELQYAAALYEPATAARLLRRFEAMLLGFSGDGDRRIGDVPLADEEERRRIDAWNRTNEPVPAACIHHLFERQARERPAATAVVSADVEVAYGELNARANHIARRLRRLGAGPETRVGVCMRRTPEMVAALLGVLKSGAAYVPLDPSHPPARIEQILRAARATAVLTDAASRPALPRVDGLMSIDLDATDLSAKRADDLDGGASPENLAYVITTSGSTGGPKGVEIEHRSAAALLHWLGGVLTEDERASFLASTSLTFDASVVEVFGPLSWGGSIVLTAGPLDPPPPGRAARVAAMVPSVAAELLRERRLPSGLTTLLLGGEALSPALARELYATGTVERVINLYGPTEDTTYSTFHLVPRDAERMAIGRSLANRRAYALDPTLRPAPVGVPGEVWVAGAGVSRGYAGRPALTAERYLPDPWGPPGARMYRTLDLARRLDDGSLEYLGRRDAQVKVRGVRIEPGEVEAALAGHPAIAEAAVDARGPADARRLVAWLTAAVPSSPPLRGTSGGGAGGGGPTAAALRDHLRARLPEAMIPSAFVWLDALPRTTSGKVDRRALPEPPDASPQRGHVAPRTELEAQLAALWSDVLGAPLVGIHDDFFDLGGQSILASRLAARVRAELGREMPLAMLLHAPTVARLAAALTGPGADVRPPIVPLHPHGDAPPLFLAPPGGGHVVCYHALAGLLAPSLPVHGLQSRGLDDGSAPHTSVEKVAAYFVDAIREMRPEGPYHVGGWSFGGLVAWEMARQLSAAGAEVGIVALLDTAPPPPRDRAGYALDHARVLQRIVADLVGWTAASNVRVERLLPLPPREQALEAIRQARQPRTLPPSRVDEVLALTRVRQANLGAMVDYDPPAYGGHLTYFRTVSAERARPADGALEYWGARALGGMTVHRIGGAHGTILNPPYVRDVAEKLARDLAALRSLAS
jgi:amino acid adenylation domain-containing protein